jgi:hypothetical protein
MNFFHSLLLKLLMYEGFMACCHSQIANKARFIDSACIIAFCFLDSVAWRIYSFWINSTIHPFFQRPSLQLLISVWEAARSFWNFKQLVLFMARFAYIHIRRWNATHKKYFASLREKLTFVKVTVEFQYPFPYLDIFAPQTSTWHPREDHYEVHNLDRHETPQNRRWRDARAVYGSTNDNTPGRDRSDCYVWWVYTLYTG